VFRGAVDNLSIYEKFYAIMCNIVIVVVTVLLITIIWLHIMRTVEEGIRKEMVWGWFQMEGKTPDGIVPETEVTFHQIIL